MTRMFTRHAGPRFTMAALFLLPAALLAGTAAAIASSGPADDNDGGQDAPAAESIEIQKRWFDRLTDIDRAAIEANVGFAPPPFTDDLTWYYPDDNPPFTSRPTWESLRGKVVIVQSLTTGSVAGRAALGRADRWRQPKGLAHSDDVVVIAVHTPENVDRVDVFLERRSPDVPIAIDPLGLFCDTMGFYERPVNVVIDRRGAVRFAGLNPSGLEHVVEALLDEPFDSDTSPEVHPADKEQTDEKAEDTDFPPPNTRAFPANNLQGRQGPPFVIDRWITDIPPASGRVIIVDFWATWCEPCRLAIPHMNQVAKRFPRDVTVVGVSDESNSNFQEGMAKHDLSTGDFDYALAIDPEARMKSFFGVRGISHIVMMSSDGVVRWQGSPSELTAELVAQTVEANRKLIEAQRGGSADGPQRIYRWTQR